MKVAFFVHLVYNAFVWQITVARPEQCQFVYQMS